MTIQPDGDRPPDADWKSASPGRFRAGRQPPLTPWEDGAGRPLAAGPGRLTSSQRGFRGGSRLASPQQDVRASVILDITGRCSTIKSGARKWRGFAIRASNHSRSAGASGAEEREMTRQKVSPTPVRSGRPPERGNRKFWRTVVAVALVILGGSGTGCAATERGLTPEAIQPTPTLTPEPTPAPTPPATPTPATNEGRFSLTPTTLTPDQANRFFAGGENLIGDLAT